MEKNKRHEIPIDELSNQLCQVYFMLGWGNCPLHKLVPSETIGYPAHSKYGTFLSQETENDEKYLSVTLGVYYDRIKKNFYCSLRITDGDDWIMSRECPFTLEEWKRAVDLYNSLYIIDRELLTEFS